MLRRWACVLRLPLDTSCGSGSVAVGSRTVAFQHFADTFGNAALLFMHRILRVQAPMLPMAPLPLLHAVGL